MAPVEAGSELRLSVPRSDQLSQWGGLAALRQDNCLCDVVLRGGVGEGIPVHAVVLALVSPKLRREFKAAAAKPSQPLELEIDAPPEALRAVLDYVYEGSAQVAPSAAPHVLRVARHWELTALQEALTSAVLENLTAEIAAGLFALGEPFGEQLGAAARTYVLSNFVACSETQAFGRWPAAVLEHLLRSDDLATGTEEVALACLMRWCRSARGGEAAGVAALSAIRWPLLSCSTLDALAGIADDAKGLRSAVASHSAAARRLHQGRMDAKDAAQAVRLRKSYAGWWAGSGCAVRGGGVVAGRGAAGKAGVAGLKPRAIRPHEGTLLFLDAAGEPGRIFQWFLRAHGGRSVAGKGSDLTGPGADFEEIADVWSGPDDAFYVLDRDAERVVRVSDGEAEVVGKGKFKLDRPCALCVGKDGVYVLDAGGARVVRFAGGCSATVAGSAEPGDSSSELNAGPTGRLFVAEGGRLYVSDTLNHRVQRWDPGAREGVTVAGGHGCGLGADQLSHPAGLCASADGTLFVADTGNHRVVRWCEGGTAGVVAAGGCGSGDAAHQLCEPLDVVVEPASGSLLVADLGNLRVVRWSLPAAPSALVTAVEGQEAKAG